MKDVLTEAKIREELNGHAASYPIQIYSVLDSTNTELKRQAREGACHGTTILAEQQTAGKGRMGRSFYSPASTGIYMSMLIKPDMAGTDVVLLTTATSVAVCRALQKVLGVDSQIKWVNDIYVAGRKVCGILAEAVTDSTLGKIDSVIIGVGINVSTEEFPEELQGVAGSVGGCGKASRNQLVAAVLKEFWDIYEHLTERLFMQEYRSRSNVIGKEVRFLENEVWCEAKALDIDNNGGLVVECVEENGEHRQRTLHTGEITLRVK